MPAPATAEVVDKGLMALIAWAGNASAASRALADSGISVGAPSLLAWSRGKHAARYQELRDKYAGQLEAQTVAEMREMTQYALTAQRLAIEKAIVRLEGNKDQDPAKTAANMAAVVKALTDKQLALQGRPTQITETRNPEQIMRGLIAQFPQIFGQSEPASLPPGDASERV